MIQNDGELEATKARRRFFQGKGEELRQVEGNPQNYRPSAGGYLAAIDRMNLEVRNTKDARKPIPGSEGTLPSIMPLLIALPHSDMCQQTKGRF